MPPVQHASPLASSKILTCLYSSEKPPPEWSEWDYAHIPRKLGVPKHGKPGELILFGQSVQSSEFQMKSAGLIWPSGQHTWS